jgi:hypothetical protein
MPASISTVELDVPQLDVWHELSVHEQRRADTCPKVNEQDDAALSVASSISHLGHTCCVGVVEHHDRPTQSLFEHLLHPHPDHD